MLNDTVELYSPQQFRLVDRKANMINVAGKRSSLSFLNAVLTGLPGVVDGVFCARAR
jgi:acyl-coenzyme A synthetase/AMP-(fatty) acid ligase